MTRILVLLAILSGTARADVHVSLDTDPTTFLFDGYSAWLMAKPIDHLRVGVGGFGLDFPSFLVPVLNRTGEDGWDLRVDAVMGFAGYMNRGFYAGAYTGYLRSAHRRSDTPGEADEHNLTVLPVAGYQWFPFGHGFYLQPWVGATIWLPLGGSTRVGSHEFADPHVIPIAAFHVGYEL